MKPASPFAQLLLITGLGLGVATCACGTPASADPGDNNSASPTSPGRGDMAAPKELLDKAVKRPAPDASKSVLPDGVEAPVESRVLDFDEETAAKVNIDLSIAYLAERVRSLIAIKGVPDLPREDKGLGYKHPLTLSLLVLRDANVVKRMTDAQRRSVAALGIYLLDDTSIIKDDSPHDGARVCVQHVAQRVLESVAGRTFGNLFMSGGLRPDGMDEKLRAESVKAKRDWAAWWEIAAGSDCSVWSTLKVGE
ncbi:MAG: hypothetical protein AB7K09_10585 [Planctomycetota bacterium]